MINGAEVENFDEISNEAIRFFIDLYTKEIADRLVITNLVENRISGETNKELEVSFSMEEVKAAVFSMQNDKALGLDGFSMHFYHVMWDVIKEDLMRVFAKFHDGGELSQGMR